MLTMTMTRLQMNLKFLNYYFGEIDGIKGNQTTQAIREYQVNNGLAVDGIAGQNTIDSIRALICSIQEIIGANQDGVAGNETVEKTKEWQTTHGLTADGICGTITRGAMFNSPQPQPEPPTEWNFPHFQRSEFACKCGCGFDDINLRLVQILEDIRSRFGGNPAIITSGCRCAKHNAEVGGVQGSRHVLGKASDFYIQGVSTQDLLNYCQELVNQGVLRYTYTNNGSMSGVVHIDIQ